jgi:1,4-dihydroxy-2-naphthoate octaprenyltransferase
MLKKLGLILRMGRVHFLFFGFLLYSLGFLLASVYNNSFDITKFLIGYLPFGFAQLSVSYSNDYFDQQADLTSNKTMFSGGSHVLVEYPELHPTALKIAILLLIFSWISLISFTVAFGYSFWLIIFGILGGLLGWFYTAPPLKLSYRGLGEIATMIAVGLMMPGMGFFVSAGSIRDPFIFLIIPLSLFGLFFIITVELPDFESDIISKKRNIVISLGRQKAKFILIMSSLAASFCLLTLYIFGALQFNIISIFILSFLPLISSIYYFLKPETRETIVKHVLSNMVSLIALIISFNIVLIIEYMLS